MSHSSPSSPLLPHDLPRSIYGPSFLWRAGALFAAVGIAAGAFGAHGLRHRPGMTAERVHAWETASHYNIFNGLGLLLVSLHPKYSTHRFAGPAIMIGGLIFSGSIMLVTLAREWFRWLGPVTPIGGTLMIAGYLSLAF